MSSTTEQQWISTASMNRFYDHCYLIECAYHIISRYCCSFTNLLTHDDGSIPYYLVQKVKIAVEYGKILLNSRYRPFQHQLRILGVYDYIDQPQYEKLCILWNTIKAETQIVEMYFNQISLLIYPVVSSTTLPFLESVDNDDVSALIKINAIIHSLITYDETSAALCKKNVSRLLKSDPPAESTAAAAAAAPTYLSEEELGMFIVNSIIEPLFAEDEPVAVCDTKTKNEFYFKGTADDAALVAAAAAAAAAVAAATATAEVTARPATIPGGVKYGGEGGLVVGAAGHSLQKKGLRCMSPEISDFVLEGAAAGIDQLQMLKSNLLAHDLYNIFHHMDDELLLGNLFSGNSTTSASKSLHCDDRQQPMVMTSTTKCHEAKGETRKYSRGGDNFRSLRCDNNQKKLTFHHQRRYPKRSYYDKKYTHGNYEFVNKKFGVEILPSAGSTISVAAPGPLPPPTSQMPTVMATPSNTMSTTIGY